MADGLLPGSLSMQHLRWGKSNCRCAKGEGREVWSLTFMVNGKKHIPKDLVEEVGKQVETGRKYRDVLREVLTANAQLLVPARKQRLI